MIGDLLSVSGLILAVLGLLYSAWYPAISDAIAAKIPEHFADRVVVTKRLRIAFWGKALPLAVASLLTVGALAPDALAILTSSLAQFRQSPGTLISHYDAVSTLFSLVVLGLFGLSLHLLVLVISLLSRLNSAKSDGAD